MILSTIPALNLFFSFFVLWPSISSLGTQAAVFAHRHPEAPSPSLVSSPPPPLILEAMNLHHLDRSFEDKYFHEPGNDDILGHYDSRYFKGVVDDEERSESLTHMMRAYLDFFKRNNLETWIAHGTLLGWWWNSMVSGFFSFLGGGSFYFRTPETNHGKASLTNLLDLSMGLGHRYSGDGQHACSDCSRV
jgi:hypothetical protein